MIHIETRCRTAYHDGSPRYLPAGQPLLGQTMAALVVTGPELPTTGLWARTTPDGDAHFTPATIDHIDGDRTWWRVEIPIVNPRTTYRFLLDTTDGQRWLTQAGVRDTYGPDTTDFAVHAADGAGAVPTWAAKSVAYQVFIDRFHASQPLPETPPQWSVPAAWTDPLLSDSPDGVRQLYGGDLWGVTAKLEMIASLGADLIYLTPFFPAESNHRYDSTSFDQVDPLLGGDEALIALVEAAHALGIRVIGDITLNHCGSGHEWFRTAQADPSSPERGFFFIADDGSYASFCDVPSLPKFDHRDPELRRRLYEGPDSTIARYLQAPFNLDGWRVDVAQSAGRYRDVELNDDVARTTRATVFQTRADALLVAEHGFDASRTLEGDGWMGTMAYSGFTRPVWSWLATRRDVADFWGVPGGIPAYSGTELVTTMTDFASITTFSGIQNSFTLLDSHDTARFHWIAGADNHVLGAALQLLLPGIPMIFAGDEIGVEGRSMEDGRRPYPWDGPLNDALLDTYRQLIALRAQSPALAIGSLRWLHSDDDRVVFLREDNAVTYLVQVLRADAETAISIDVPATAAWSWRVPAPDLEAGESLPMTGPSVAVYRLA